MTRAEIEPIANAVRQLKSKFLFFEIAGSYRRWTRNINNLNVVVVGDPLSITQWANQFGGVACAHERDVTCDVSVKYGALDNKGIAKSRVTFHVHDEDEWAAALVHWTGSADFNRRLEERASSYGFLLNENGLWLAGQPDERVPGIVNEASLFDAIGMEWVPPEQRK
jgi:DNA polymerase/3'-5' exonuclease PolX